MNSITFSSNNFFMLYFDLLNKRTVRSKQTWWNFLPKINKRRGQGTQQVGGKLIILRIWKKLSQPKSVQFWIPMGMPSWQVQKNLGVCLAVWRLGGCLCLQKVGFLKVPFFTLKSGFLAILTPLLL